MTVTKFSEQRDAISAIAAVMAWGQIKAWFGARDLHPAFSAADCRDIADQVAFDWIGRDFEDACEAVCCETLRRLGFEPASGDLNQGTIRKMAA